MANKPILQVNKLVVGQVDLAHIPGVPAIPGTGVINGPLWIGYGNVPGVPTANCMIGPGLNPVTLDIKGVTNIVGNTFQTGNFTITGTIERQAVMTSTGTQARASASVTTGTSTKVALNQGVAVNHFQQAIVDSSLNAGSIVCGPIAAGSITCGVINSPTISSLYALAGKGFDIPHPTKDSHRLRYICLEGPEVGAYIRGTLKGVDIIELPEYWRKLCKPETITVNLTPIGSFQELYVEENIEWGTKIKVKNNSGSAIHCHYTVFAERVTNDKLQVEYEGLTPYDYPGDNSEYALGGWDYATHKGEVKPPGL
jgi:hypothetical protein